MQQLVAIALSGGIDSLVAAALLKEQGYRVIGLHFITGFESGFEHASAESCSNTGFAGFEAQALQQLAPMVEQLDIPIHIIDLRREFKRLVVDYFIATYQQGKTPNPCLVCNPSIKFDILFEKAQAYGAEQMATGHYARIARSRDDRMHLLRGIDPLKEQSYFLARLSQRQLRRTILPLGGFSKNQTRQMAEQQGLRPAAMQESQDICFIRNGSYGDFLKRQPDFASLPGTIEDLSGQVIGRHSGLHQFTIGQRRGINCPAAEPYYVIALDSKRNALIVGSRLDLLTRHCRVNQINWISNPPSAAMDVLVRVRYRHAAVPAKLVPVDACAADIAFDEPQSAVTPGQGAVFYQRDQVLGGGWIQ
jgi:tRNA-specific 2-thiouridylase